MVLCMHLRKGVLNKERGGGGQKSQSSRGAGCCKSCWEEKVTIAWDPGAGLSGMVSELSLLARAGHWAGRGYSGTASVQQGVSRSPQRGLQVVFFPHRPTLAPAHLL